VLRRKHAGSHLAELFSGGRHHRSMSDAWSRIVTPSLLVVKGGVLTLFLCVAGALDIYEFVVAIQLIDDFKASGQAPPALPAGYVPACKKHLV
jgi:hypothetical protein